MINGVDWHEILEDRASAIERVYGCKLVLDADILRELDVMTAKTLAGYGIGEPNIAKIAGHVSFWIRKLKPVSYAADTPTKLLPINEELGMWVGIALCRKFGPDGFRIPSQRVRLDWVASLRAHSHSPHSSALSFEMLFHP